MTHPTHGTTAYRYGCRCAACRAASAAQRRYQHHRQRRGEPAYVDAEPVRQHITRLRAAGVRVADITATASMSSRSMSTLIWGRHGEPQSRVRPWTAETILNIPIPIVTGAVPRSGVPRQPSIDLLRALAVLGWPRSQVLAMAGLTDNALRKQYTHPSTEAAIRRVADLLATKRGPHQRTRTTAARKGWTTDALWADLVVEDITGNDFHAGPNIDEAVVQRVCDGEDLKLTRDERLEVARRLLARHVPTSHIIDRLHVNSITWRQITDELSVSTGTMNAQPTREEGAA